MSVIKRLKVCLLTRACQSICLSAHLSACNISQMTSKDFDTILDCEFLQKFDWEFLQNLVNTYQICLWVKENNGQFMWRPFTRFWS